MARRGWQVVGGTMSAFALLAGSATLAGAAVQNGITYQSAEVEISGGTPSGGSSITCGNGFSLGAGVVHDGASDILLASLYLFTNFDGDYDASSFNFENTAVLDKEAVQTVICDGVEPRYPTATAGAPYQARTKATAYCSSKRHVYGGGVESNAYTQLSLVSSHPVDGPDRDRKPDDGWRGSIDNHDFGATPQLLVTAACGKEAPAYRESEPVTLPGAGALNQTVTCPESKPNVLSGGQKLSKLYANGRTSVSYPYASTALLDSWHAIAYSAGSSSKMSVFAVCIGEALEPAP